jgi:hypothetical protein
MVLETDVGPVDSRLCPSLDNSVVREFESSSPVVGELGELAVTAEN